MAGSNPATTVSQKFVIPAKAGITFEVQQLSEEDLGWGLVGEAAASIIVPWQHHKLVLHFVCELSESSFILFFRHHRA
jgi:hypothetical protein